ncbi:2-iminobutanoate/2-iminopropanoate deaminase [Candidatus Pantoea symbiotica]|jgi:2-iminobutanoate/2-iminopropanoate deaminase|uniref:2-iminobutanoate/2-iminopropanoate deaminase n=1 Tax=Candidatus Pantoea symbiotica TaxID=1884370 RepID=A0A1I4BUL8_9GAMM|nr:MULTISPECIES: RidA family protein [Pantoea]KAJ9431147.1 RidA family protein [Pantoea sp. YR343]MRT24494.1 RidA family protein [Enterobacteriaceae bacterium RIT697]SFK72120.1 2-iminobutanoate/2-iminopropanoate deaminase [Pantoea symbiotica]SFV00196.1 2-iminobutanoate/2-iminopropanoate deaminase [Pantoea sp. YR525]
MKIALSYPGMNASDRPMGPAPLSAAVLHEPMLFISGQVAIDPYSGEIIGNDIASQTRQVLKNVGDLLSEAQMTFDNVVRVTIYLIDLSTFSAMNAAYSEFFQFPYPARATVGIQLNHPDLLVEMEVTAMR